MKKNLLKPLLIGAMSFAMAFSVSAVSFADDTTPADSTETSVTSWVDLYTGMGLQATAGEGLYDAVTSATGIYTNHHYQHIPAVVNKVVDETAQTAALDGVVLSGKEAAVTPLVKDAYWESSANKAPGKKYGTDELIVVPDDTVSGYTWNDYLMNIYAVTVSDGSSTVGALPWVDFYGEKATAGPHYNKVEVALNNNSFIVDGARNGQAVHRFDSFYTDGVLNPGNYTVTVYAEGYAPLTAIVKVPTYTAATVAIDGMDAAAASAKAVFEDLPEDYSPIFSVDGTEVPYANGMISVGKLSIGSHSVVVKDGKGKYNDLTASLIVSTDTLPVYYNGAAVAAASWADERTLTNYVSNITTVNVGGVDYAATGRGGVKVINADGSIDLSRTSSADTAEPVAISVTATGYPKLNFITGTAMEEPVAPAPAAQDQILKITAKNKTFKAKALKKKNASFTAVTVKNAKGKVTYKATAVGKKAKKALTFKNGKITVKKKTRKGTYKMKVTVKAAAAAGYNASVPVTKTITVKVK